MMFRIPLYSLAMMLAVFPMQVLAIDSVLQQEQLEQARQQATLRDNRLQSRPFSAIPVHDIPVTTEESPQAGPSFWIRHVQLDMDDSSFQFLSSYTHECENKNVNVKKINQLVHDMNEELLRRGYATSRVIIPEQNIADGVLRLQVQAGRIHQVRYSEGSAPLPWRTAFPIWEGDILNVHLLEQGVEQMKKLSSQDVSLRLIPAETPGQSDIELTIHRTTPVHGILSLDDSGLTDTGRWQFSADIGIDNPFYGNDYLQIDLNGDVMADGYERGTRGQQIYYRIPYGKETFSISYSRYTYHQTVYSTPYDFLSRGKSDISSFSWDHLISRNQHRKTSFDVQVRKRNSHYFINDLEIPVQTLHTTALEAGLSQQVYCGADMWYGRIGHRMGVGWFGAMPENPYDDGPKTRYHMWLLDVDYRHPFMMGHRQAVYTSSFHGQWTAGGDRLYGVDMISMGNRYTVRGFDGEMTLMAESGWYWRNELASEIAQLHSQVYVGLDVGAVYGPAVEDLLGHTLVGTVVGLRGDFLSGISYDAFIGCPLYKPDGYHTDRVTTGLTLSWRF